MGTWLCRLGCLKLTDEERHGEVHLGTMTLATMTFTIPL